MNKLSILCCINIISIIYAAPLNSDAKIYEILQQLEFFNTCPAVLHNNINVHKSNGGLSHCRNVSIGNPPEQINLLNLNEFYCIGLLAADVQLCSGNRTNKMPKNYVDLNANIDKIKNEHPDKICNELKQLKLFNETANIIYLKKWIEVLDKTLHGEQCVGLCSEIETGNTNVLCSMIYYINNNISYVTIAEKKLVPLSKEATNNDNAPQKVTTSELKGVPPKTTNVVEKSEVTATSAITSTTIKDSSPQFETKVEAAKQQKPVVNASPSEQIPLAVNNQPVTAVDKNQQVVAVVKNQPTAVVDKNQPVVAADKPPHEEEPVIETTSVKPTPAVPIKDKVVGNDVQVKTVQITEESKPPSPEVNPNPVIEESQKVSTNVESSSVSSTISGARDDLAEDYFDDIEEMNKANEDQLIPQTNSRKETIEIVANDQDRHRIPTEDGDDMEDSNFFSYFMFVSVMFIAGYVVYHNKQKIMALLLEGRKDRNSRRRPNTSSYRKLNSNLEEAVTSKCSGSASHVIY